jgi:hypothetical protein
MELFFAGLTFRSQTLLGDLDLSKIASIPVEGLPPLTLLTYIILALIVS